MKIIVEDVNQDTSKKEHQLREPKNAFPVKALAKPVIEELINVQHVLMDTLNREPDVLQIIISE